MPISRVAARDGVGHYSVKADGRASRVASAAKERRRGNSWARFGGEALIDLIVHGAERGEGPWWNRGAATSRRKAAKRDFGSRARRART